MLPPKTRKRRAISTVSTNPVRYVMGESRTEALSAILNPLPASISVTPLIAIPVMIPNMRIDASAPRA